MEDLLTLKEIASRLGVPESNLRYYRNRIGDFLPSIGKGRRRRYFPEALEIFQKTIEYINDGVTLDRIHAIFADNKPLTLRDDIARPAQEELANLIVQKLKSSLPALLAPVSPDSIRFFEGDASVGEGRSENALIELQAQLDSMKEKAATLEEQVGNLENENFSLNEKLAEKETLLQDALLSAQEPAPADTSGIESELAAARDEISGLRERIFELENSTNQTGELEDQCRILESEKAELLQQAAELELKLAERERIAEGQKAALENARAKRQALQEEIDRLRASS